MYNYMNDTFDNESENTVSVETYNTPRLNMHNTDPDFHQVKRYKKPRGHFVLEFYETRIVNDYRIRNAVTGLWYRDDHPKCTTNALLFYDSPEQFERHQRTTLAQPLKEKWHEKNRLRILANHKIK